MDVNGFDFAFQPEGEIIVSDDTHDINTVAGDALKIQLSYNRIKSVSHDWFVDELGADLEELIGKHCTSEIVEYGKRKIIQVLSADSLWGSSEIAIKGIIKDNTHIIYSIYLKLYSEEDGEPYSYEIETELDLVKGVFVRYGWKPKRHGWHAGVGYRR